MILAARGALGGAANALTTKRWLRDALRHILLGALIAPETRATINGGFHALRDKRVMGPVNARNLIIDWKSEEILRLAGQLNLRRRPGPRSLARSLVECGLRLLERSLATRLLSAKNLVIRWKSDKVFQLAIQLDQKPEPGVAWRGVKLVQKIGQRAKVHAEPFGGVRYGKTPEVHGPVQGAGCALGSADMATG